MQPQYPKEEHRRVWLNAGSNQAHFIGHLMDYNMFRTVTEYAAGQHKPREIVHPWKAFTPVGDLSSKKIDEFGFTTPFDSPTSLTYNALKNPCINRCL